MYVPPKKIHVIISCVSLCVSVCDKCNVFACAEATTCWPTRPSWNSSTRLTRIAQDRSPGPSSKRRSSDAASAPSSPACASQSNSKLPSCPPVHHIQSLPLQQFNSTLLNSNRSPALCSVLCFSLTGLWMWNTYAPCARVSEHFVALSDILRAARSGRRAGDYARAVRALYGNTSESRVWMNDEGRWGTRWTGTQFKQYHYFEDTFPKHSNFQILVLNLPVYFIIIKYQKFINLLALKMHACELKIPLYSIFLFQIIKHKFFYSSLEICWFELWINELHSFSNLLHIQSVY